MNIKSRRLFAILALSLFCLFPIMAQHTPLPYFCGFETEEEQDGWVSKKRASMNTKFVFGKAVHSLGKQSMYVSCDDGVTASYDGVTSGYNAVAFRKFSFAKGDYTLMFDCRIAGEGEEADPKDALRVACIPTIVGATSMAEPQGIATGSDFPQAAYSYPFVSSTGKEVFLKTSGWEQVSGDLQISEDGEYWIAFYFKANGGNTVMSPGACIDNVQIDKVRNRNECASVPSKITFAKTPAKNPTDITISWTGNASEYELMYNIITDSVYTHVKGIKGTSYSIPLSSIVEGCYTFRVRAVCNDGETAYSLWNSLPNQLVYDPAKHCVDYLNLSAESIECTYGNFANPYANKGVVDYGFTNENSVHTLHYMPDERDRLTDYKLSTVPPGMLGSVRVNNWKENPATSGSIQFEYTVSPDAPLLLFHYAAVLQFAENHPAQDQTRIHVEVMSEYGRLLSSCTEIDFNAAGAVDGSDGKPWQTYNPKEGDVDFLNCPIKWLDWQVLGINMDDYIGETVKVRVTMHACVADYHFGYGYFAFECTESVIEGMSCGAHPNKLTAPEGFNYKWVRNHDKMTVSTDSVFDVEPTDTASYTIHCIYPENPGCEFTLAAYTKPRMPRTKAEYKIKRDEECRSIVEFTDKSVVFEIVPKQEGDTVVYIEQDMRREKIKEWHWDFGVHGYSNEQNPTLVMPAEGDTFMVKLTTVYGGCDSIYEFLVEAPSVDPQVKRETITFCTGKSIEYEGRVYSEETKDTIEILDTESDCPVKVIYLNVVESKLVNAKDTAYVCSDKLPYDWRGKKLSDGGVYNDTVWNPGGCIDTIIELRLDLLDALELTVEPVEFCSDDDSFIVQFYVTSGAVTNYQIKFNAAAKAVGFEDTDTLKPDLDKGFTLLVPKFLNTDSSAVEQHHVRHYTHPGHYSADVTFFSGECDNKILPLEFTINYSADMITQRWNDVLGVKSEAYNGGYRFLSYQWYLNGEAIPGEVGSQLYQEGISLRLDTACYSVDITDVNGVTIRTCCFTPQKYEDATGANGKISVTFTSETLPAKAPASGTAYLYSVSGLLVSTQAVVEGENSIQMPSQSGIYILRMVYADGSAEVMRVTVRQR